MFEKKEFSQLLETMRGSLQDKSHTKFDFTEGSVVRTLFESFAYEMAVLYEQMERVYLSGYVDSAEDTNLDRVVATLGIKRGEPEYAIFNVTFERDKGIDEDIEIPLNTLVTTEDSEKSPRKAYKTIELKTIPKGESSVEVRVKPEQPGQDAETEANTIVIMPQPIPGVKSVNNQEAVKFIGKDRETDSELRDRAKGTLLAASGANANSIQNALLSISGVNEVKVRENFSPEAEKFGIVEVIVDTADWFEFNKQKNQKQLQDAIDRVRAAGVYVLLKAPEPVYFDGTFQIEVAPELKGSPETRQKLEKEAREKITSYIRKFPMGQSLAIAQLTKRIDETKQRIYGYNGAKNISQELIDSLTQEFNKFLENRQLYQKFQELSVQVDLANKLDNLLNEYSENKVKNEIITNLAQILRRRLSLNLQNPLYKQTNKQLTAEFWQAVFQELKEELKKVDFCQQLLAVIEEVKNNYPATNTQTSAEFVTLLKQASEALQELLGVESIDKLQKPILSEQAKYLLVETKINDNIQRGNRLLLETVYSDEIRQSEIPKETELTKALVSLLNEKILSDANFYRDNKNYFEGLMLDLEAQKLIQKQQKQEKFTENQLKCLNRLLLESAYPLYIHKNHDPYRERLKALINVMRKGAATKEGIRDIVAANLGIFNDNAEAVEAKKKIIIEEYAPEAKKVPFTWVYPSKEEEDGV
ncbi:MAG: baseplate J/gp47 family protein [Cyanobacteria bacterium P01_H01_bin.35]